MHIRSGDLAKQLSSEPDEPRTTRLPYKPFPLDALPASIARFVKAVAAATGTDAGWAALAALTVMAGCIGNRAAVILKRGWVEPAILWAALVGKSGSIKSVVLKLVARPLVELFKLERQNFAERMREYETEMERYKIALKQWKSDQATGPPTDKPVEPERPKEKRVIVADVTVEGLAALLGANPLGLLLVRDELAALINSFNRYAGGKGSDMQNWLSMNDGGHLIVDRKIDGNTFVDRASVSVLRTIQPFTLQHVFGTLEREAGLLARILLAAPPDRPALWTDAELPDEVAQEWQNRLAALLARQPGYDETGGPKPRLIGLAVDAKQTFIEWHDRHAREVSDLEDDHLRAHWSKLKGMCARIALLFACAEAVDGMHVSAVSLDCVERALRITEWLKRESQRVYTTLAESDEVRASRELVEWISRKGASVTVRDVTHGLWRFRGDAQGARAALDELAKSGVGRWVRPPTGPSGGRPVERFELNRPGGITITETPPSSTASAGFGDGDESGGEGVSGDDVEQARPPTGRLGDWDSHDETDWARR
jgi:hypothetical protein